MKKITFNTVNKWVKQSTKPLKNKSLEDFQEKYFGENKHSHYRFFYHMVAEMKPKMALEIGIDHGHTIVHMAAANRETRVVGIDKLMHCADGDIHRQYANCEVYYLNSLNAEDLIQHLVKAHGKIGVVFQDSSHHYEESLKEWELYSQYLDKNAIWVVDDVTPDFHDPNIDPPGKGMVEYFDLLPGRKKVYDNIHVGTIVGVALI